MSARALLAVAVLRVTCATATAASDAGAALPAARSFQVAQDAFQLDGANITLLSGSIHYHRVHPALWRDRLARLRSLGLNAIQT